MVNIGINGFGRIGRLFLRIAQNYPDIQVTAINSRATTESHKHLFTYDTMYGKYNGSVEINAANNLVINGKEIKVFRESDPENIPWHEAKVDIVIEATGEFVKKSECLKHMKPGVKTVIISAPGKDDDGMYVIGVNEQNYKPEQTVISCASCTTNCLAPLAKVLDENFKISSGFMTTVHAYTTDQRLLDNSHHKDLRRARTAGMNIVPTSTGAAKSIGLVLPQLKGKLDGVALRVPVATVSMIDLQVITEKPTTIEDVNAAFTNASSTTLKNILGVTNEPLVSSDFIGSTYSGVVDLSLTNVINKNNVKVFAWYDNEYGYTCRLVELAMLVGKKQEF